MRVLWITNQCLPQIAERLKLGKGVFEGWNIFPSEMLASNSQIVFAVASPAPISIETYQIVETEGITGYIFDVKSIRHQKRMIQIWKDVAAHFNPDIVHIQGTEMAHGMLYIKANGNKNVVASIQGLTSVYERYFYAGIDFMDILKDVSLYDLYSSNSIFAGRKRAQKSGRNEEICIKSLNHVIGRTTWDMVHAKSINPKINYHFCNEILRKGFYQSPKWKYENCEKYSIFLSQCKYPIKALHMVLKAMPLVLRYYPNAKIYIGSCLRIIPHTLIERIAPTNYGGYLLKMIKKMSLENNVFFLGNLSEEQMISQYLKANVFVSPSSIENSPNSLCEAQILGVPSISSEVGGVCDLTQYGKTTFIYRFEEYELLAYYICRVFKGDYNYCRFQNAMDDAEKRHNPQENLNNMIRIYSAIIGGNEK